MVNFNLLFDLSIVMLIVASITEVTVDIREMETPRFLPGTIGSFPPSHPAMAAGLIGLLALALGTVLTLTVGTLDTGRLIVAVIALLGFGLAGGFVLGGE